MGLQTQAIVGRITTDYMLMMLTGVTSQSMPYSAGETQHYDLDLRYPGPASYRDHAGWDRHGEYNSFSRRLRLPPKQTAIYNAPPPSTDRRLGAITISVSPSTGPGITYTYDSLDHLKTATRAGVTTEIDYDNAGRKTLMRDPDMGEWTYS